MKSDGISFTSGVTDLTVADDGSIVTVSSRIGVELTESGVDGGSTTTTLASVVDLLVVTNDNGTTNDSSDDFDEGFLVLQGTTTRVKDDNNNDVYVRLNSSGDVVDSGDNVIDFENNIDQVVFTDASDTPLDVTTDPVNGDNETDLDNFFDSVNISGGGSAIVVDGLTLDNDDSFNTSGNEGVYVRSKGGNGGKGSTWTVVVYTKGGDGGDGSAGGNVLVTSDGEITVSGASTSKYGVYASSRGGEGGDGGGAFALAVSDPGRGGDGGKGGEVRLTAESNSDINTSNEGGHGLYASSRGGDGGSGGRSDSAVALGSKGGDGGDGGDVFLNNFGTISTTGDNAHGMFAESVGAGAGDGSDAGAIVSFGGNGGGFTNAGNLTVTNGGTITTSGFRSYGVLAESLGGGGGDGGNSGGIFTSGGSGGSGGDGGTVDFTQTSTGAVTTSDDYSTGILLQSKGGGGGNGGNASSGGVAISVAIGGTGGLGGDGKQVEADIDGSIKTGDYAAGLGHQAYGVFAQSAGGGGGTGGTAVSISGSPSTPSVAIAIGGTGGEGGDGGVVDLTVSADIVTEGSEGVGVFAQSVGGGGGSGGTAVAGAISTTGTVTVGLGGSGDKGGKGDTVDVNVTGGSITTAGVNAHGLQAQSVGGGGGKGGVSVAAGLSAANASVSLGGSGAGGGAGGAVSVANLADIATGRRIVSNVGQDTNDAGGIGIFAQSVGKGGGDGGLSVGAGIGAGNVQVSVGGRGAGGGDGGTVDVDNDGAITTSGADAYGVLAQSIGGGGGRGGGAIAGGIAVGQVAANVALAFGGDGGDAGNSEDVTVDNGLTNPSTATITTLGDGSSGIYAQSQAGPGGVGGFAIAGSITVSKDGGAAVSVALGGAGGAGGDAGKVTVRNRSTISTGDANANTGVDADGIYAQSLGGAGGRGGFAIAGAVNIAVDSGGAAIGVALGGGGGGGGAGDEITVDNTGAITTVGDNANAILAQSQGGDGGRGGLAVAGTFNVSGNGAGAAVSVALGGGGGEAGSGGAVTVCSGGVISSGTCGASGTPGAINTSGVNASGVLAQSLGGEGGVGGGSVGAGIQISNDSGGAVGVSVGGGGGDGGASGAVTVDNFGVINTAGADSYGIYGQSQAGHGGAGGFAVSGTINFSADGNGAGISVAVGGTGGKGGDAGAVNITSAATATITTKGDNAAGVFGQSAGGSGGSGGFAVSGAINLSKDGGGAVSVALGGKGEEGGSGDTVTIVNDSAVSTGDATAGTGDGADGIFAQSLGGSGGKGGFAVAGGLSVSAEGGSGAVSVALGGGGGGGGTGDAVTVSNTGRITTRGDNANAILAQSQGGDGGRGGFSVAGSLNVGGDGSGASINVALGGGGGEAGSGGSVVVCSAGAISGGNCTAATTLNTITTSGDGSAGVVAQSVGGEGGVGGFAISGGLNVTNDNGAAIGVSVGGGGGDGGAAQTVRVDNFGVITTGGADAEGILAQSLAGHGGKGGFSVSGVMNFSGNTGGAVTVAVGGGGGAGGAAEAVTVNNSATIGTVGARSTGILAQSQGGSGGVGGFAVAANVTKVTQGSSGSVSVGVGGGGGDGGTGKAVTVTNSGVITTSSGTNTTEVLNEDGTNVTDENGDNVLQDINTDAHGLVAQSIGGDGGVGGFGASGSIAIGSERTFGAAVAVGGGGGNGGDSGNVTVDNTGNISTSSLNSIGLMAQSIAGSGGAGGGAVTLSYSKVTQSGAGGNASVSVGGAGGDGGDAGQVDVANTADITTLGNNATGVLAQSVGGDGGQGGFSVAAAGNTPASFSSNAFSTAVSVSIGGFGGPGGKGKRVEVGDATQGLAGAVSTSGKSADGVLAQSLGGDGGAGGFSGSISGVFSGSSTQRTASIGVSVGGFGGAGGEAGVVSVTTDAAGSITTTEDLSTGVTAQSIGGSGGSGGGALGAVFNFSSAQQGNKSTNMNVSVGGFGGGGGQAGAVDVTLNGSITTGDVTNELVGQFAHGVVAQSIGGDGGKGGFSGSILFTKGADNPAAQSRNYNLSVSVGGFGGGGAIASTTTVDNNGAITTYGERAFGVLAQSIGGGGGAGGDTGLDDDFWGENVLGDTAVSKAASGNFDDIDLGAGGSFAGSTGANSQTISTSVGGFGGDGNNADTVTVRNNADGSILTTGYKSHGVVAQSIGGGGGVGGISTAVAAAARASNSGSYSITVGGFGGGGGDGSTVDVTNDGSIATINNGAAGIYAQSIGGAGGDGGDARGFALQNQSAQTGVKPNARQLSVAVGGFGGGGGDSGAVNVANSGDIDTVGFGAYGVYAQSVGGGGGAGGMAETSSKELSALFENDKKGEGAFKTRKQKIAVGGFGGNGGVGGTVTVNNTGTIETRDEIATAIYAQSVGGGGGGGGKGSAGYTGDVAIGGFGGAGNDGGSVYVGNTAGISTVETMSDGIFAQSVGGGGGDGGQADFGSARSARTRLVKDIRNKGFSGGLKSTAQATFLPGWGVGVGGFGGASGDGGDVVVCNGAIVANGACGTAAADANIVTTGTGSYAIFAQSVGGGGGVGGRGIMTNVGKIAIGGLGGAAGDGGDVTVVNNGTITATGIGSYGVFAQSVGGGGGLAGDTTFGIEGLGQDDAAFIRDLANFEDPTDVEAFDEDADGSISVQEQAKSELLYGFEVENSRFTADASLDTTVDANQNGFEDYIEDWDRDGIANGKDEDVDGDGIQDQDLYSDTDFDGDPNTEDGVADTDVSQIVTVGGVTYDNSSTGTVLLADEYTLDNNGLPITDAQASSFSDLTFDGSNLSTLAGNGASSNGDVIDFLKAAFTSDGTSVTFKNSTIDLLNGVTGDGGNVSVTTTGDIIVTGGDSADEEERAGAIGIFAQSVGGGGGLVGRTVTVSEADIDEDLNADGDKTDLLDVSTGQAFAGTIGDATTSNSGRGGAVSVNHSGAILAPSWNGFGVFAQSTGPDGGSNIDITVDGGVIQGGEGDDDNLAAAILVSGGATNTIDIGENSFVYARSGRALLATDGDEAGANAGEVVGDINFQIGTNSFVNEETGTLRSGDLIALNDGTFTNEGVLAPGALVDDTTFAVTANQVQTTAVGGEIAMTGTSIYQVDVHFSSQRQGDLVTATLDADGQGLVQPTLLSLANLAPVTIIDPTGVASIDGMTAQDTPIVDYSVGLDGVANDGGTQTGGDTIDLLVEVDFTIGEMTRNQLEVASHFNNVLNGPGSENLSELFAYAANLNTDQEVIELFDKLTVEGYAAQRVESLFAALDFTDDVLSCERFTPVGLRLAEGTCYWGQISGRTLEADRDGEYRPFSVDAYRTAAGVKFAMDENWRLGVAFGYERSDFAVDSSFSSEGDRAFGALTSQYLDGPVELSLALSGGHGVFDSRRVVGVDSLLGADPFVLDAASVEDRITHGNLRFRAAYRGMLTEDFYFRPMVDVDAVLIWSHQNSETGAGPANVRINDHRELFFAATPSVEIGGQALLTDTLSVRPFVRAGASFFEDGLAEVDAAMVGAPGEAGAFTNYATYDQVIGKLSAGFDFYDDVGVSVGVTYDGALGETTEQHGASLKFTLDF